jgi:hypothetical protein
LRGRNPLTSSRRPLQLEVVFNVNHDINFADARIGDDASIKSYGPQRKGRSGPLQNRARQINQTCGGFDSNPTNTAEAHGSLFVTRSVNCDACVAAMRIALKLARERR